MIVQHIEQVETFEFVCDRCGEGHDLCISVEAARETAAQAGFVITDWMQDGSAKQTCFCGECAGKLRAEATKAANDLPKTKFREFL